jgi:hypothetical protein
VFNYLVVGANHAGNVAHGESLAGLQAKGHRWAAPGVGASEHHVLHSNAAETIISALSRFGSHAIPTRLSISRSVNLIPGVHGPVGNKRTKKTY